ncbi:hypothetical protein Isop_1606 [Isosphaera pallida ATCC 43644]|uniref:Helix-turn-helix type 11 domain-containing protein n=2 Tax=Isosphaera pallida TaxID=128 RepID=E8QZQ4_ISOPI|nr:hypothetical protein Isop_1606 [Isosphaera pallida ATCC 43644]
MARSATARRRPSVSISMNRAARLHRLVKILSREALARDEVLERLNLGLRTFYRELELLRRCGIKIRLEKRRYMLTSTPEEAEGKLPFPDPQLSFAEMNELAQGEGPAARRLAQLLREVLQMEEHPSRNRSGRPSSRSSRERSIITPKTREPQENGGERRVTMAVHVE